MKPISSEMRINMHQVLLLSKNFFGKNSTKLLIRLNYIIRTKIYFIKEISSLPSSLQEELFPVESTSAPVTSSQQNVTESNTGFI